MTLFEEKTLKDQDDNLSMIYTNEVYNGPDPDDDDWVSDDDDDDDDDFDLETGDDIDEDYVNPNVVPDTPELDEDDDEGTWADDDEDFISDDDEEDEDITLQSDDEVSEADRLSRGDLGGNFEDRPYGKNRRTGRLIDHEPGSTGSSGSGDPNLE